MTCSQVQSLVENYLDRELTEADRRAVASHLAGCPACRAEWEVSERLRRVLSGLPNPEPPSDYWDEVSRLIMARTVESRASTPARGFDQRRREERVSLYQSLLAVAASLIIFFAALLAGSNGTAGPPPAQRADVGQLTKASLVAMTCADPDSQACAREQARLARGLLLMGRPGLLGGSTDLAATLGIK